MIALNPGIVPPWLEAATVSKGEVMFCSACGTELDATGECMYCISDHCQVCDGKSYTVVRCITPTGVKTDHVKCDSCNRSDDEYSQ